MKKIFSILVATMLLAGMMLPMAVSAIDVVDLSANLITRVEFESLAGSFTTPELKDNETIGDLGTLRTGGGASGGKYLMFDTGKVVSGKYTEATFPVSVTEEKTFNIEVMASLPSGSSNPMLVVNNVEYTDENAVGLSGMGSVVYSEGSIDRLFGVAVYNFTVKITPLTETVTVRLPKAKGRTNSDDIAGCYDYIEFSDAEISKEEISTSAPTRIEFEDYTSALYLGSSEGGIRKSLIDETDALNSFTPTTIGNNVTAFKINAVPNLYRYQLAPDKIKSTTNTSEIMKLNDNNQWEKVLSTGDDRTPMWNKTSDIFKGYITITVPISVKATGKYQFDMICVDAYRSSSAFASPVEIYRGTNLIAQNRLATVAENDDSVTKLSFDSKPNSSAKYEYFNHSSAAAAARFIFDAELSPADKFLTFKIGTYSKLGGSAAAYEQDCTILQYLDFLEITPVDFESKLNADGTGIIRYSADAAERTLGGKAILALYNGDQLVSIQEFDNTTGEGIFNATKACDGFTKAKFFIWENVDNCVPKISVHEITNIG